MKELIILGLAIIIVGILNRDRNELNTQILTNINLQTSNADLDYQLKQCRMLYRGYP